MAAVPGYSYKPPFALDQMFPQANPLSEKNYNSDTDHIGHISDQYIFPRNYNDVNMIINHTKRNHAAHNDTLHTANAPRYLPSCSIAVNTPCFPTRKKR
jgi:hypothetical protein